MKKATKFDFKTLLVLLLSLTLCMTCILAACNKTNDSTSSSSSSSSTEETKNPSDTQLLKNGDFEYNTFTKKDTDFPVNGSSVNWVRSYNSVAGNDAASNSSKYPDGIIDTADDAYNAIRVNKYLPEENPRSPEFFNLVNTDDMYKVSDYENGEGKSNEDKKLTSGTKILMLHNHSNTDGLGSARKFTSSSFSLERNKFAELSVWVKTAQLTSNAFGKLPGVDYGAYVAIENTVSSSAAPLIVKNIDTKGNWAKYTFYLSSSDFSTSSYKLVLGLGFGSKLLTEEHVQGYAFFDNAHLEIIDKTAYETAVNTLASENRFNLYTVNGNTYSSVDAEDLVVKSTTTFASNTAEEGTKYTESKYALSHNRANLENYSNALLNGQTAQPNKEAPAITEGSEKDFAKVGTLADAYAKCGLTDTEDKKVTLPDADTNSDTLYFNFSENATSYKLTTNPFTVAAKSYLKLSFWYKAETLDNSYTNGLTATLRDLGKTTEHEEDSNVVKTVLISNDNTKEYENENYNGWKQYVLFVSNTIGDEARDFEIEFSFGTTEEVKTAWEYTRGFAIVTSFAGYELTADDYAIADTSSYSYAKKVSLSADLPNGEADEDDDQTNYSFNYSEGEKANMFANGSVENVEGYQFVKADTYPVGGNNGNEYGYGKEEVKGGLINSKYTTAFPAGLKKDGDVQPIFITATSEAVGYGFVGSSATFSANSTYYVTVDVYASNGAVAYFYLASPNALEKFKVVALKPTDYIDKEEELNINEQFVRSLTGVSCEAGEEQWITLAFLVSTGNQSISYRPEFWLGTRDGKANSNGSVYFNNYNVTNVDKDEKKAELENQGLVYIADSAKKYTRIPTTITYTEFDDHTNNQEENESSEQKTYKTNTTKEEYEATAIYFEYASAQTKVAFYDFTTVDVEHERDITIKVSDDSSSSEEESTAQKDVTDFNWALQLTSIIIAVVLIALLVIILIRTLNKKNGNKKSRSVKFYGATREEALEKAHAKKLENERRAAQANEDAEAETEAQGEEEVVEEYDYDNPEINNNDKLAEEANEDTEAETAEEATEENKDGE